MGKSRSFLSILIPSATVFISSFCIMVLELVASSVLAVFMAGLALGSLYAGEILELRRWPFRFLVPLQFAMGGYVHFNPFCNQKNIPISILLARAKDSQERI